MAVTERLVSGYYVNTDPPTLPKLLGEDTRRFSLGWAQTAGGMISTPEDLTKWVRAPFRTGRTSGTTKARVGESCFDFRRSTDLANPPSNPKGFGPGIFQVTDPSLGLFWGYQGSTIGYRAAYAYFPKSGLIICVFTNSQPPAAQSQVNTVLFKKFYETLKPLGKF
jgi:D-alanyl-D-alanine carboxypeptidase